MFLMITSLPFSLAQSCCLLINRGVFFWPKYMLWGLKHYGLQTWIRKWVLTMVWRKFITYTNTHTCIYVCISTWIMNGYNNTEASDHKHKPIYAYMYVYQLKEKWMAVVILKHLIGTFSKRKSNILRINLVRST